MEADALSRGSSRELLIAALFTPSRSLLLRRGRSLPVVLDATHNLASGHRGCAASKRDYGSAINATGRPWPRTTAVNGDVNQWQEFSLNENRLTLEHSFAGLPVSTLRPSRLEPLTVGMFDVVQAWNRFGRALSWCAPRPWPPLRLSLRPGCSYLTILRFGRPVLRSGRHPGAGPVIAPDVHDPACLSSIFPLTSRVLVLQP